MRLTTLGLLLLLCSPAAAGEITWIFAWKHVLGQEVRSLDGQHPAVVAEGLRLTGTTLSALVLDGQRTSVNVSENLPSFPLPAGSLTVEAWVLLHRTADWGGFFSALQDNGDFERGFLLGFRRDRFSFALASAGKGRLTYLTAPEALETGRWYHVVGTFDGETMRLHVDGETVASSEEQSGAVLYPPSGVVEIGSYRDDNEFFRTEGLLHCVAVIDRALSLEEIRQRAVDRDALPPPPREIYGPFLRVEGLFTEFVAPGEVEVTWETAAPEVGAVELGLPGEATIRREDAEPVQLHRHRIDGLVPHRVYQLRIRAGEEASRTYELDTTFQYGHRVRLATPPTPDDSAGNVSELLREKIEVSEGWALVLGHEDGALTSELLRNTDLQVVVVEPDGDKVQRARADFAGAGVYGSRVSVHQGGFDALPYGPHLFNVIVSESAIASDTLPVATDELRRVLKPGGGVLLLGSERLERKVVEAWSRKTGREGDRIDLLSGPSGRGAFVRIVRGGLDGAGEWTQQYGRPDNASFSDDALLGGELDVAWWGRPGPRPMPDRGPRNPSPLYSNGRLYVLGNRILFGLDAYNGTIRWSLQVPELRRANMVRDSGNLSASSEYLYAALGSHCYVLDGETGARVRRFSLPGPADRDWGHVSVVGDLLLGTATARDSRYLGDEGEWYESDAASETAKVVGDRLFALRRDDGELRWEYGPSTILHTTITVANGHVYFIEGRDVPEGSLRGGRLVGDPPATMHLICLDLERGTPLWQRPVDLGQYYFMIYLSAADDRLFAVGADRKKAYQIQTFSLADGTPGWAKSEPDRKGHHGGHLQHPVFVGERMYVNRLVLSTRTGESLEKDLLLDRRGCGSMAGGRHALVYRHHYHGLWDLRSGRRTDFFGVRGGCWIGPIPVGGMLLAPETSAGCSCTHAIQVSVGFVPEGNGPRP